jgi:hypothetical protein
MLSFGLQVLAKYRHQYDDLQQGTVLSLIYIIELNFSIESKSLKY